MKRNDLKTYPADEVKPLRSGITDFLRSIEVKKAVNVPIEYRSNYITAISRLHKRGEGKWKTVKVSEKEFAIIRKE